MLQPFHTFFNISNFLSLIGVFQHRGGCKELTGGGYVKELIRALSVNSVLSPKFRILVVI